MPATTHEVAMAALHRRSLKRRIRAILRDTLVLLKEFRGILLAFVLTIAVSTVSFQVLWRAAEGSILSTLEALYIILTLLFFQPVLDFPSAWYLELYFFLMPLVGAVFLTLGVADFAIMLFKRQSRQAQWEAAVASTFNDHIIIVGLGHLGIRVVRELIILDEPVVAVELKPDTMHAAEAHQYDIPVITGDARQREILEQAGLDRASALIICTNDDLVNLQIASRVRETNPDIRLVMRMFDDQFGTNIADRFDISAVMSSSGMSAPAFAGAATHTEIIQTFKIEDQVLVMGRIEVRAGSRLDGCHVSDVEREVDVSVVLQQSGGEIDVQPNPGARLQAGDVIAVVATLPRIKTLTQQWNRSHNHRLK